jgi:hypothetical protein
LAVFLLTILGAPALAQDEDIMTEEVSGGTVMFDLVILRPLGLASQILGLGVSLVALPVAGLMGNSEEVAEKLIVEPAKFTWGRPLGQLP